MVNGEEDSRHRILVDEQATLAFGARLAQSVEKGVVYLEGHLGTGKTTIVRGWLRQLGHQGNVKSPTYTIVESYQLNQVSILHIDLYRIVDPTELEYIGLPEQIANADLALLEWPKNGEGFIPRADLTLRLQFEGDARLVTCSS